MANSLLPLEGFRCVGCMERPCFAPGSNALSNEEASARRTHGGVGRIAFCWTTFRRWPKHGAGAVLFTRRQIVQHSPV